MGGGDQAALDEKLTAYAPVLKFLAGESVTRQRQLVCGVQEYFVVHDDKNKGMIESTFAKFMRMDVAAHEAFEMWKEKGTESEGFTDVLVATTNFFASIEAEESDDDE